MTDKGWNNNKETQKLRPVSLFQCEEGKLKSPRKSSKVQLASSPVSVRTTESKLN